MSEYRERKPTSKGLLVRVKCQQGNARMSRDPFSLSQASWIGFFEKKPCYVAGSITSQSFPDFLKLSESCQKKAVFVQRYNTSFIEVNIERTRLHTNWHFTRTMYHWSLILRSFRAKPKLIEDDANGFVKALCQFPHLWFLDPLFNLVPRALVTLVQRNGKTKTSGKMRLSSAFHWPSTERAQFNRKLRNNNFVPRFPI